MGQSGKGSTYPSEHRSFRDAITCASMHQMTSQASISHPTYFLQSSFPPDGSSILFTSYRTGTPQLFDAGFPDGAIRQLTEGAAIHPYSPAIHPDGDRLLFVRGGGIFDINRKTLAERAIVEFAGASLGECSMCADGEWLVAAIQRGRHTGMVVGRFSGRHWRFLPFPRTVIHPQFHPIETEWIEFAADPAPRMHRVRRDGSGLECLYEHGNEEFVVHETFLGRTGDLVYTVWPKLLYRLNWQTRERSLITQFNAWHITPDRAGKRILCDTNHPDEGIFLIDAGTGARKRVCLSGSSNQGTQWLKSSYALAEDFAAAHSDAKKTALSWMETAVDTVYGPQWTHPHPSFSHDEKCIAFGSDRTGHTQVYVAELGA